MEKKGGVIYRKIRYSSAYRVDLALVEPDVDVGVREGLVHVDAPLGIHHQHLGQQVAGLAR